MKMIFIIIIGVSREPMASSGKPKGQSTVVHCAPCSSGGEEAVLRCDCGSLLARYVGGQVELKCRRCKRTVLVPLELTAEQEIVIG